MIGEGKTRPNATKKKQSLLISTAVLNTFNEAGKALTDQLLKARARFSVLAQAEEYTCC